MGIESLSGWVKDIEQQIKAGRLDVALDRITGVYFQLGSQLAFQGRSLSYPKFDQFCQDVGAASCYALFGDNCTPVAPVHDVILITELTCHGGHGEILKDIAALNDVPLVVVVTNLHARKKPVMEGYLDHPNILQVDEINGKTMLDRLRNVQQCLDRPSVRRVFMLHHGYDAIANAAATRSLPVPAYYLHHCDHAPALGCHLDNVVHVDLHNIAYQRCRHDDGLNNRYLCLTARPEKARVPPRFAKPYFKTASCGGEHKLQRLPYPFGYSDMVQKVLEARDGCHYHLGPLSGSFVTGVRNRLTAANIDPGRFVHVGSAPKLADILRNLEIDLYLPTLPQGGGKGMIDAMSVGVPLLIHQNGIDRLWGGRDLAYPEALSWGSLEEFEKIIRAFDEQTWQAQSAHASQYFDQYHAPSKFADMLMLTDGDADVPPLKPYRPDPDIHIRYGFMNA